ncbi:MAG: hypothetical protein FH748_17375 [Balneolaceae bacterium]|nr:hypothetical protein [Balneolaceae bacterium]
MKQSLFVFFLVAIFSVADLQAQNEVIKDDIAFRNGDHLLSGTLILPEGANDVPVLLFLGGITPWGDFHPNRASFISENLENIFPQSGIGVMYFSPRGVGSSSGKWQRTNFQEFAEDAKAAVKYLKQRREIDSSRIGIIGHDEDAWVAQIVAAEIPEDIKLMISLAGAPYEATRQLINEYHSKYVCDGQDSTAALTKATQKAQSHENWVSILPLTKRWRHMKMKQDFDPANYIQALKVPSLFLFAENDGEVYSSWALDAFDDIFTPGIPDNFTIDVVPGANHYFKVADKCYENGEGSIIRNYSFRFKEILRNWVFAQI